MSWKTTDSAKRSGISDYNRGTIKQNTEYFTADYGLITDLSLQELYGNKNDGILNNTLQVTTDSLALNRYDSSNCKALIIAIDKSDNAYIGRNITDPDQGYPNPDHSFCIDKNGNMMFKTNAPYVTEDDDGELGFTIEDDVGITKDLYVRGDLDVWQLARFHRGKNNGGPAVLIEGATTMYSNLTVLNTHNEASSNATNVTTISGGDITSTGDINCDNLHTQTDISVNGNIYCGGAILPNFALLSASQGVTISNDLDVCGNTRVKDLSCANLIVNGRLDS